MSEFIFSPRVIARYKDIFTNIYFLTVAHIFYTKEYNLQYQFKFVYLNTFMFHSSINLSLLLFK